MRIAIFTEVFLPKVDGITNRLRNTVRCLREQGHEVAVFAPDCPLREYAGARVHSIPALPFPGYPGLRLGLPDPRIVAALHGFAPDVVHAVGPACLGVWGIAAARSMALPIVASYHTDLPRYAPEYGLGWVTPAIWPIIRTVHNAAHVNLCPSSWTRQELRSQGVSNVGIWRGGVDARLFHPAKRSLEVRNELTGGRPDRPIVLYAGRLSPEKGLDAMRPVLEACPEAQGVFVGDGPAREPLERAFAGMNVHFTGFLRGEALASAFASADVFFMPSTTETLGFVVLEAMASGLAVVAADAGGIPDMVHHGENGLLFDPSRPLEAAGHVADLLGSDGRRRFLSELGRKTALEATWDRETERLVDDYRRAIAMAASGGIAHKLHRALLS